MKTATRPPFRSLSTFVSLSLFLSAALAHAEDGPKLPPIEVEASERPYDWAQLESGEWIKGEITRVHEKKLYFDSDEFDNVSIDWSDVASLIPKDTVTVRLSGRRLVTGDFEMRNGKVHIVGEKQEWNVERAQVVGLIPGTGKEVDFWSGSASFGLTGREGNTQQSDITLRGEVKRQTHLTRAKVNYTGQISTSDGDKTANSHRIPATFDYFMTQRLYWSIPAFEWFTDEFQNIGNRISVGSGLGYEILDTPRTFWEVSGGVAYTYTSYDSVLVGQDDSENDAALTLGTEFDFDFPHGIEWDNIYRLQIVVTDIDKTNHHAESELSFDIWGPLEFEMTFIFDRVNDPKTDSNGDTPKSNDYRFTVGLGFDI